MQHIDYSRLLKLRLTQSLKEKNNFCASITSKRIYDRVFTFTSFTSNSGLELQKYYDKLLKEKGEIWIGKELKKVKDVEINNTVINKLLIDTLSLMFKDLHVLTIRNCTIEKNCCLSIINTNDIRLVDSVIESFKVFNQNKSNLDFVRCNINSIGNSSVLSEKMRFFEVELDFYKLFLMNNFPDLDDLCIESEVFYDGITNIAKNLKNSFTYLPYSCPNITKLRIEGVVDDIDFLIRLTKLVKVGIASTFGDMAKETLLINNKEKLNQLETRNYEQIEIKRTACGVFDDLDDIRYITSSEINRVLTLNDFLRTLSFTEQEMVALTSEFNFDGNYLDYVINRDYSDLKGYYRTDYDKLIYMENEENLLQHYNLVYKYGCIYYDEAKEKIVIPEKAILYIDGTPVILNNYKKRIVSVDDAKKFRASYENNNRPYDSVKHYIEAIRDLAYDIKGNISINEFEGVINEIHGLGLGVIYKDVLGRVVGNKEPIIKLSKVDERWKYIRNIGKIIEKNRWLLAKLINSKFELFSMEELLVIVKTFPYREKYEKYEIFKGIDDVIVTDELINSIDVKCDFKYLKLINSIDKLNHIYDDLLVAKDNYILTEEDLAKMREYIVKDDTMSYDNKFFTMDSYETTFLPEVDEYENDDVKVLKL